MSAAKRVKTTSTSAATTSTSLALKPGSYCLVETIPGTATKSAPNLGDTTFRVHPDGLKFLQSIKNPIVIVAIAGQFRTGKSTLLNLILELDENTPGFKTGGTTNRVTQGIWVHSTTVDVDIDGTICTLMGMDSEGLGSKEASGTDYDLKTFSLTWLLADVFCLNQKNSIDENEIERLALVSKITEKIRAADSSAAISRGVVGDGADAEDIAHSHHLAQLKALNAYFPAFIWVIRDAELMACDDHGNPISDTEYLENWWNNTGHKNKDRIREALRTACPRRDCVRIGTPTLDPKWKVESSTSFFSSTL